MKTIKIFFSLLALTVLAGCASTNQHVSRNFMVTGNVLDIGAGREVALVELCRFTQTLSDEQVARLRENPALAQCRELTLQSAFGTNVVRDVATGAIPVTLGAIVQGEYAKGVVREQARVCQGGRCGGGGGAQAAAGASNVTNVTITLPCAAKQPRREL